MKINDKKFFAYLIIQACLFVLLLVFQIIIISKGRLVFDRTAPLFPFVGSLQIALTAMSFAFSMIIFFSKRKEGMTLFDMFPIYFFFALTADIFFSGINIVLVGHICFLICYIIFLVMRKPKIFEYIAIAVVGVTSAIILLLMKKYSIQMNIDIVIGVLLVLNCVMMWIKYIKTKDKGFLYLAIGVSIILISDSTIAVRGIASGSLVFGNIVSLITWPTYIVGNALFLYFYSIFARRNAEK